MKHHNLLIAICLLLVFAICGAMYITTLLVATKFQSTSSNEALMSLYTIGGALIGYLAKSLEVK